MATIEQCQQTILLELQMMLTTVNDINANLIKTNQLLEENPTKKSDLSYKQLVDENVRVLSQILKMLDQL